MTEWDAATAEWYADKYGDYATNQLGLKALQLTACSTVVDVGCGTGCALRFASDQVTGGILIGIDPVHRMLEIAKEQTAHHAAVDRILFFGGSAENLPLKHTSTDYVLAFDSFDHWQDKAQGLREVNRILKPSGHFIIVKDGGLPNGSQAKKDLKVALTEAGFKVAEEKVFTQGDVVCTRWICSAPMAGPD